VVAFATGGLIDIVDDRTTGTLPELFDPLSLAAAIRWVLEDPQSRSQMGMDARTRAELLSNSDRISRLYLALYQQALMRSASAA
jgi:glycosyltransferase involved in cell wall biosynthesis